MIEIILIIVIITALIIASITDIKTREVPDWLNYSLIISGLAISLIYSLITSNWLFFGYSVSGALIFLIFAYLMFYTAQWGGGDSKMLIGLGALIGFNFSYTSLLVTFIINILLVGAVYGMVWSFVLVVSNFKKFSKEAGRLLKNRRIVIVKRIFLGISVLVLGYLIIVKDVMLSMMMVSLLTITFLTLYLWVFIKAVEKVCMLKYVEPEQLTEGDWIAKEVKIKGEYITGPKDLGIEKEQIHKLIKLKEKGKIGKVLIKIGMPFIPVFLMAYIVSLIWGNLILGLL
ncbi:MAG: A24 family peptidase [Candidatus Woesearchaeota archaeon]|jgi:Flp pilus assembly protein protease CpaA|nr:A24 family peptidase [Candidatus Woesearchaeota archaeon]MDP7506372.1 A24 family peptidase [Candidatus Woesearchaeota archaeon]|tara:strand:- start:2102 stop:2962 length:861 start_codon:yes stop_codon:yes gene_type:complete